jgi:phage tail-like protein
MRVPRPYALIGTEDQWRRVSHDNTALVGGAVQLFWTVDPLASPAGPVAAEGAGLAFDRNCRLYHSVPAEGRVERLLWAATDSLRPASEQPGPIDLFEGEVQPELGDFTPVPSVPVVALEPRGLAVDDGDRLFIADSPGRCLLIYDLWSRRLLRRVPLSARPLDLAAYGRSVYVVLASPAGLAVLEEGSDPRPVALPAEITQPARLAVSPDGKLFVLDKAATADARVIPYDRPAAALAVPFATDLAFQVGDALATRACAAPSDTLVVARLPGADFRRFCIGPAAVDEMQPLKGRDYDGLGIVGTPDGRIGFWTARGFRHAVAARVRYLAEGRVLTFRLDSGEFHTVWGRVFLDACVPRDTEIRVHCVAVDEPPEGPIRNRLPPANEPAAVLPRPDLSPPMPPVALVPPGQAVDQPLHRRETGRETPWVRPAAGDPFETYEAPVWAGPGRYLWVTLLLKGNTRVTPQVRALRAEYPTHDYLRRIPRTFSRDEQTASFLRRYLALFEGMLGELEARADARHALIDSRSAPAELLPWLAGFLGLVLDERWPEATRRTMIAEAARLFRFRGTVPGLSRFLEIYTGKKVILIEKFRLRGLGGAALGASPAMTTASIVGAGFRVGGALGVADPIPSATLAKAAFDTFAHRFSVLIPAALSAEQLDVVRHILEIHRPAHTVFDVCTVEAGMRVGQGLYAGLTSLIGRTSGFQPLQVGGSLLGGGTIVGRPVAGTSVGGSRLGADSRIG